MPPNVRDLVGDIREAVARLPHEALVDILVYVFKEYVVEGPAPLAAGAPIMHDELDGQTFGDVIRALQQRLDLPELELFDVQGDRVLVRVGGRSVPLDSPSARPSPVPPPMATPAPAPSLPPVEAPRSGHASGGPQSTGTASAAATSPAASPGSPPGSPPGSKGLLEID